MLFQELYSLSERIKNKKIAFVVCMVVRTISNLFIPLWYKMTLTPSIIPYRKEKQVIISLTSFPKRFSKLWIVIESLMRQKEKPDYIRLYLSNEQINSLNELPQSILRLQKKGLQIYIKDNDLRSHKKYYYAFQENPDALIITVDDDIIYPSNITQELLSAYRLYPNSIISRYGHYLKICNGNIIPYAEWSNDILSNPSNNIFFGSGGGTLFQPNRIHKDIFNYNVFMDICKLADDIWLNAYIRLSGFNVYLINNMPCSILNVQIKSDDRLTTQNVGENLNDIQIKNVCDYFKSKYNINPFDGTIIKDVFKF